MSPARSLLALLLLSCTAASVSGQPAVAARIDSIANSTLATGGAPGLAIAVVRGQDTIVMRGYGRANVEHDIPVNDRTVFRIGSVTKQFTAAAAMKLVEEGKLRLDGTIGDYLPEYEGPGRRVTIHQLLNHTSGIPSYTDMGPRFWDRSRLDLTHEEMIALWAGDSLEFEPGSRWDYNNSGYYMLGVILDRITGQPYAEHLRATQFQPLGLTHTMYCDDRAIVPNRAAGYARDAGRLVNAPQLSMTSPGAAGALCSTARDLVKWHRALAGGRVVSPASYTAMTTPTRLSDGTTNPYGYGLANERLESHRSIQHGGGIHGFTAFLTHFPDDDLTIAVLANGPVNTGGVATRIARAVLGLPEPPALPPPVALPAAERIRYVGTYDLAPALPLQVRVFVQGEQLFAQATGQGAFPLTYRGNHTFTGPEGADIRMVFTVEGERATQFVLHQGGRETPARRVE